MPIWAFSPVHSEITYPTNLIVVAYIQIQTICNSAWCKFLPSWNLIKIQQLIGQDILNQILDGAHPWCVAWLAILESSALTDAL